MTDFDMMVIESLVDSRLNDLHKDFENCMFNCEMNRILAVSEIMTEDYSENPSDMKYFMEAEEAQKKSKGILSRICGVIRAFFTKLKQWIFGKKLPDNEEGMPETIKVPSSPKKIRDGLSSCFGRISGILGGTLFSVGKVVVPAGVAAAGAAIIKRKNYKKTLKEYQDNIADCEKKLQDLQTELDKWVDAEQNAKNRKDRRDASSKIESIKSEMETLKKLGAETQECVNALTGKKTNKTGMADTKDGQQLLLGGKPVNKKSVEKLSKTINEMHTKAKSADPRNALDGRYGLAITRSKVLGAQKELEMLLAKCDVLIKSVNMTNENKDATNMAIDDAIKRARKLGNDEAINAYSDVKVVLKSLLSLRDHINKNIEYAKKTINKIDTK